MTIHVVFVCLGNICRSPTADGVFRKLVNDAGLQDVISVDSAGTAGWHEGRAPDTRTLASAKKRGYDLSSLRARQVLAQDFSRFDYILAMDSVNLSDLVVLKPQAFAGHLGLFLAYATRKDFAHVPDPYLGGDQDFELVLDLVEDAAMGLLAAIRQQHNL